MIWIVIVPKRFGRIGRRRTITNHLRVEINSIESFLPAGKHLALLCGGWVSIYRCWTPPSPWASYASVLEPLNRTYSILSKRAVSFHQEQTRVHILSWWIRLLRKCRLLYAAGVGERYWDQRRVSYIYWIRLSMTGINPIWSWLRSLVGIL